MRAEHVQVIAAGVLAVKANAAVTGNTAIHLVADEGAEVLVDVRALGKAEAPVRMPGHHRHVLQMAGATFLADRAVMRMVGHQELDDRLTHRHRILVPETDPGLARARRHARHDDAALRVVLVAELRDRALAAGTDAAKRRMPAEVRQVVAEFEYDFEQIARRVGDVRLAVDQDRRRRRFARDRHRAVSVRGWVIGAPRFAARSKSTRKYFIALCSGSIAPGACAQKVRPGPSQRVSWRNTSRSSG